MSLERRLDRSPATGRPAPARSARLIPALLLFSLLALQGCGDEDDGNPVTPVVPTPTTQLTGMFVSGFDGGLLSLSISGVALAPSLRRAAAVGDAADTVVTAFLVLSPVGGGAVNLTGTFDTATDSLHCASALYEFHGLYYPTALVPSLEGSYSGPNGDGLFTCVKGSTSAVRVFCGDYRSTAGPSSGRWNLAITGSVLVGLAAADGASTVAGFSGTVTGSGPTRSLAFSAGGIDAFLSGDGTWDTATDHAAGTWTDTADSGTWSADLCLPAGTGAGSIGTR